MDYVLVNKMDKIDKAIRYTKLYNIYKSQLSKTQQEIIEDYFLVDLSITEIAENRNISRSAVEDALSKGINKLDELEKDLMFLERNENIKNRLESLKSRALNMNEVEEIEDIEKELDYGIWSING